MMLKTLTGSMVLVGGKWWSVEEMDPDKGSLLVSDEDGATKWVLYTDCDSFEDTVLRHEQNLSLQNAMILGGLPQ